MKESSLKLLVFYMQPADKVQQCILCDVNCCTSANANAKSILAPDPIPDPASIGQLVSAIVSTLII